MLEYQYSLKLKRLSHIAINSSAVDSLSHRSTGKWIADTLAKASACEVPESSAPPPFWKFSLELNTRIRPLGLPLTPEHHWYQCSRPGVSLALGFTRQDQTLIARFREEVAISKQ
ncbi:hypothetical protein TNCV_3036871 [Trichonephila clavipes]|nr:hypothetical protein TNCV_3036871 [Trichonephila clavipes]